ncbi:TPA: hypothetical protein OF408_004296 [Escherichia coli]|nr:hypothetical protein [Escherichia coli]
MTNLPHDYYVNLVKILLKKASYADKFRLAEIMNHGSLAAANRGVAEYELSE